MDSLAALLALPENEKQTRGLVDLPREIHQQPDTWASTRTRFRSQYPAIKEFLAQAGLGVRGGPPATVLLVGAGTSDYVARSLVPLLRQRWGSDVAAVSSTDLLTDLDNFLLPEKPYVWISFSRSGDSSEGVAVLDLALERHPQIRHLVVSCNQQGQMVQRFATRPGVLAIVLDDAVNDRSLAMTSSFSNMVVLGHCLAHLENPEEYDGILESLISTAKTFLHRADKMAVVIAGQCYSRICFLGSGTLNAVAQEAALKVLELTAGKIFTMSESSLGLRHGPLSALDDETLLVSFLSSEARRRSYELDLLKEVKSKRLAKHVLAVSPVTDRNLQRLADSVLDVGGQRPIADVYRPPVDVIFGQLLGLFSSLNEGLTPDHPSRNGAIRRVVSNVTIYS